MGNRYQAIWVTIITTTDSAMAAAVAQPRTSCGTAILNLPITRSLDAMAMPLGRSQMHP